MGALKITAILLDDSHDEADVVSIVRLALLKAGCNVDSIDAVGIPQDAVLYVDDAFQKRIYVAAIPSKSMRIDWTEDIDGAKVVRGPASLNDCIREVRKRYGHDAKILYV